MNGPGHYREAERLAEAYKEAVLTAERMPDDTVEQFEKKALSLSQARALLEKAQVHATLAQAAAAAHAAVHHYYGEEARDGYEWARVTAPSPVAVNS